MESSESETESPSAPSNCCTKDADERSTSSNLQSSDSGVSSCSEISICEDWTAVGATDDESRKDRQRSVAFIHNLLPWMQKKSSRISFPGRNQTSSRGAEKVGGTLALIQNSRPPNLPVKSIAEERYHRKQYSQILEEARKREIREEAARRDSHERQLIREERLATDSETWCANILPSFEKLRETEQVRQLWWRGLPPSIRGKVWKLAIVNYLNIAPRQYDAYAKRMTMMSQGEDYGSDESVIAIRLDVSRTLSNLGVFQEGGPLYETLQSLLIAYTMYRSDVGYVQGMSFVGAILALNMGPNDAFVCFANLLNKPCHLAAFTLDQKQMNVYYRVFESSLAHKIPKIHVHFCATGLSPDLYLLDWLYTVYAKAMPLDVTCRIWDVFVRDGDEFLFRTALGILRMFQDELLRMDFVRCSQFLTKLPENLQASVLFDNIGKISTSIGSRTFHEMISQLS